ncbi:glycoside hydrolase family 19 protein, partial [Starkeya nomas]|uniref:glycoside hydrolase family 19 protein n=1 Tax=Starkeya nomas TaxID=2666134 RepID=UPI003BF530BA
MDTGARAILVIRKLAPRAHQAILTALADQTALNVAGITSSLRLAHFLAQIAVETGGFTKLRESGNYSAKRIAQVFGVGKHSAAVTAAEAKKLAGNEKALFERVYGLGNPKKAKELGNTRPGDGWRFRGGGALQSTGGTAYRRIGLYDSPSLIETAGYCLRGALDHWSRTGCNHLADINDIRAITERVNGG